MRRTAKFLILSANLVAFAWGCTTINNTYIVQADHNSTVTGSTNAIDTPRTVSPYVTTTGKDIGEAANAFVGGVQAQDVLKAIEEIRAQIRAIKAGAESQ